MAVLLCTINARVGKYIRRHIAIHTISLHNMWEEMGMFKKVSGKTKIYVTVYTEIGHTE